MASPGQTMLLRAWREGDLETFQAALQDPEVLPYYVYPEEGYCTILQSIASNDSTYSKDFAEALLRSGTSPELMNSITGDLALCAAAKSLNFPVMETLLQYGADVNAQNSSGDTALHLLAKQKPVRNEEKILKCLRLLMCQKSVNARITNKNGLTPLQLACREGSSKVVKLLQEHEDAAQAFSLENETPLDLTEKKSFYEMMKEKVPSLIGMTPNVVPMDGDKLFNLLYTGNEDRFCHAYIKEVHSEKGLDLAVYHDNYYHTFLQYAAGHHYLKAAKVLLENGSNVNYTVPGGKKPIFLACEAGDAQMLRLLLSNNADISPNPKGETILHVTTKADRDFEKYVECLNIILTTSIDINAADSSGRTALHNATLFPSNNAVTLLLKSGANLFAEDNCGEPAFKNVPFHILEQYLDSKLSWNGKRGEKCVLNINLDFLKVSKDAASSGPASNLLSKPSNQNKTLKSEVEPLLKLSKCKNLRLLLQHPAFKTFLTHKWTMVQYFYYLRLIFFTLFCAFLFSYCVLFCSSFEFWFVTFLKTCLGIGTCIGYLIVLIDASGGFFYFFGHVQRWLNGFLIILVTILLSKNCSEICYSDTLHTFCPVLMFATVTLAALKLVLLVGRHPYLSLHSNIFTSIFLTNLKIFVFYLFILMGFAIGMHILSQKETSTLFFGGVTFEVPFVFNGRGNRIHSKAKVPFVFFCLVVITLVSHIISVTIARTHKILQNKKYYTSISLLRLIRDIEMSVIIPKTRISQITNYFNRDEILTKWFSLLQKRIFFFTSENPVLNLEPNNNNILRARSQKKKTSVFWKKHSHLSDNSLLDIENKILVETEVENESMDTLMTDKLNHLLENGRYLSARIENLEESCKQLETLLIRSLAIVNMTNEAK